MEDALAPVVIQCKELSPLTAWPLLTAIAYGWLRELFLGLLEVLTASEHGFSIATVVDMEAQIF